MLIALVAPAFSGEVQAKSANASLKTRIHSVATVSAPGGYNRSKHIETSKSFTDAACLAESISIPAPGHAANSTGNSLVFLPPALSNGISTHTHGSFVTSWKTKIYRYRFAISFPHHHFW